MISSFLKTLFLPAISGSLLKCATACAFALQGITKSVNLFVNNLWITQRFVAFLEKIVKRKGYVVYMVGAYCDNDYPVKIGVTSNLDSRLASLNTHNPYIIEIKATIGQLTKKAALKLERRLHYLLDRYRLTGEWFAPEARVEFIKQGGMYGGAS